ncbi:MAG: tryptophan synthase subunit alpha [Acidimicrobiales bacterium]|nr:tryptophan synthase subunit alpha [Acidimicrobiales bacterium]
MKGVERFDHAGTRGPLPEPPSPGPVEEYLRGLRSSGRKLLGPYITAGLPGWVDHVRAVVDAGADTVEIGIPFSDPAMDGPVIQAASEQALAAGATPASIFSDLRRLDVDVPLVAMTYYNLPFHMGEERFAGEMVDAGLAAMILPDVPVEEQGPWRAAADAAGVETVLLAGPITPDDRLRTVCEQSRGYVYGVNLMGITGERASVAETSAVLAGRLKAVTDKPVLMGFGVSTPEHAVEVAAPADGVIVGTAIVRRILDGESPEQIHDFVSSLRAALDAQDSL